MLRVLITGGAGFIGSNFIRYMGRKYPNYYLINLDALTYAGNIHSLQDMQHHPNYRFVHGDIRDQDKIKFLLDQESVDIMINFAAESHVDRSIQDPGVFVKTNVFGTQVLLDAALQYKVSRFIQISTDEVYGSLGNTGLFTEKSPLSPNSPYSASKASADLLVRSYHQTYGLPVNITRCSNNYGPFQFPEKLIPLMIIRALQNKKLPVYGDGKNIRDWLHVLDHCSAVDLVMHRGISGEVYNIGGNNEWSNIDIVHQILDLLGKPKNLIQFVEDRPGHDRRYAIDATKIRNELGWRPNYNFNQGLKETIEWYLKHKVWWNPLIKRG